MHKSKLNTNGTYSVGKTWRLVELRALTVISVCVLAAFSHQRLTVTPFRQPWAFDITLSRTYRWQTEDKEDQVDFLENLVRLFRTVTNGQASLRLDGIQDFDVSPGKTLVTQQTQPLTLHQPISRRFQEIQDTLIMRRMALPVLALIRARILLKLQYTIHPQYRFVMVFPAQALR